MGGYGSGRRGWRLTKESCLTLSISYLQTHKALDGLPRIVYWEYNGETTASIGIEPNLEDGIVMLRYQTTVSGEIHPVAQWIHIESTPAYFGGFRYWFLCPRCSRRCGKVYMPNGGLRFFCRCCLNLTYQSSNDSRKYDTAFKYLAARTGMTPGDVKRALHGRY